MLTKNNKASYSQAPGKKVTNFEGGEAFNLSKRLDLFVVASTSYIYGESFYMTASQKLSRMLSLIDEVSKENGGPLFIAKLAIYIRNVIGLRDAALCLILRLAKNHSGDNLISSSLYQIIDREDMIVTAAAMYSSLNEKNNRNFQYKKGEKVKLGKINGKDRNKVFAKFSSQVKKGLELAFNNPKFTEASFAKNTKKFGNKEIKLKDVLFLVHAKPFNEDRKSIFEKIISDTLLEANTWETNLSALGQEFKGNESGLLKAKSDFWNSFIQEKTILEGGKEIPTLGFLALLRNLRNILDANVSPISMGIVCDRISKGGKRIFPFQYVSAYREVLAINSKYVSSILEALNSAIITSLKDFKGFGFEDNVLLAADVSGSMQGHFLNSENVQRQLQRYSNDWSKQDEVNKKAIKGYDLGLLMGMMAYNKCKSVQFGVFGDSWKRVNLPKNNIIDNLQKFYNRSGEISEGMVGYATNGYLVLQDINRKKEIFDKIFLFTDCQLYGESINNEWKQYLKNVNPNAKIYLFDVSGGYGTSPIELKENVYLIGGFTEKTFDIVEMLEKGESMFSVIDEIKINDYKN